MSDLHAALAVSIIPASWEVVCRWAPHPVLFVTSGFSNATTLQRRITTTAVGRRSCHTHENYLHAEQIIIIFRIFFFIVCFMYFVLFSIVLYRTIVTVHTHNIFLNNYLQQMHKIINLSLVECLTPARGIRVQKKREVILVNKPVFYLSVCHHIKVRKRDIRDIDYKEKLIRSTRY